MPPLHYGTFLIQTCLQSFGQLLVRSLHGYLPLTLLK
ncbi:hypothetical protein BCEN4_740066 [Burkholderia cenocepacia]|nr:hypothetical protein BCEN4_740066 [Burkholderia cenocepacia]